MAHTLDHASEHTYTSSGSGEKHIVPPIVYLRVFAALIILMGLTIWAATNHWGGVVNNIVAMTIALIKATLVVLFFMQVKYNTRLTWIWAAIGFVWLAFLFLTLGDYMTHPRIQSEGWPH